MSNLLTLLSDFGLRDAYVGVMKGTIAQINPNLTVIDLTHQIPPQDIAAARFNLMAAYSYFPAGTVHVAIVDPGVGGKRRAVAIQFVGGFLVGPDNGLFSGVLSQAPAMAAVELTNPRYWLTPRPSQTFHGRDIFATVGAHLASGVSLAELGTPISLETLVSLDEAQLVSINGGIIGSIQYIDHFGNLITTLPGTRVGENWAVIVAGQRVPGCQAYGDRPLREPIALVGSHGWIEISIYCGNAQTQLQQKLGECVTLICNF